MSEPLIAQITTRTLRKRVGASIALVGFIIFLVGTRPHWFGWPAGPMVGVVQIQVFVIGLGLMALGGYLTMEALWSHKDKLIVTAIGARLVGTGYVIALTSGMADVFGLGTRPLPSVPFFGYWQGLGVLIGQLVILLGLLLMSPLWGRVNVVRLLGRARELLNGKNTPKPKKSKA